MKVLFLTLDIRRAGAAEEDADFETIDQPRDAQSRLESANFAYNKSHMA